ncbi:hypothetical protein [Streptomyces mirabilis]|uniref:hypothetical protein n=1 Tax=Streptomyces mirabilis TaxID=68239 RepID=UPI003718192B
MDVIATGNVALRDNVLYLDSAQVGVDLAHHVAYVDDTLPAVLAGRAPAPRAAAAPVPPPAHRAGPSRPAPATRPATVPAAAPKTDWWRSAPRPSWDAVTAPSRTRR